MVNILKSSPSCSLSPSLSLVLPTPTLPLSSLSLCSSIHAADDHAGESTVWIQHINSIQHLISFTAHRTNIWTYLIWSHLQLILLIAHFTHHLSIRLDQRIIQIKSAKNRKTTVAPNDQMQAVQRSAYVQVKKQHCRMREVPCMKKI